VRILENGDHRTQIGTIVNKKLCKNNLNYTILGVRSHH